VTTSGPANVRTPESLAEARRAGRPLVMLTAYDFSSARIAERAGYRLEGTLRNLYFKEGRRSDVGVWSRLAGE
jgi:hypothetical protein